MAERPPLPHDPGQVRAELQRKIRDLLDRLGFRAYPIRALTTKGRGITPLNPRRADKHPGSFVIWTDDPGAGAWCDYAIDRRGDVFDLIEYIERLDRWIDAYWWALDWLGWGRGEVRSASEEKLDRDRREAERKAAEAQQRAATDKLAGQMRGFWLGCAAELRGTPVWTYLTQARGLPLDELKKVPGALRYRARLEHVDKATGEVTEWPAMVSAMSAWDSGQVRAIHRTWLAPDGLSGGNGGKAPVDKAKKMRGPTAGCAIRVWKGGSGLTPERAAKDGVKSPLVITEGIEDALTAVLAQPAYRVWAAGSLSLLGTLGWPDCASAVVLVADNDWDKPQALAAFERVLAHWQGLAAGRPLKVVRAEQGKDLNDWARSGANGGADEG